ncbi:hypothetical protein K469DRAFT_691810 [Zopfia rhizophila CBS 207.26]|uniref:Uncharacterized protein n=1 Tax=Zopfia rhizophila CBS 207.26 TaxID=1314779 RepID=A0A6A6DTL3_9PEZI|nr:hypothetical protein K469DRAFT_691810 [Zopfia rhizophila CBS 207.26]
MAINWKDPEVKDRILAAVIASFGSPINCKEVARLFGPEATYNAIENFLRTPKKKAAQLKENAGDSITPSPSRPRTPKKAKKSPVKSGVKPGRIVKTPTKPKCSSVKKELVASNDENVFDENAFNSDNSISNMSSVESGAEPTDDGEYA